MTLATVKNQPLTEVLAETLYAIDEHPEWRGKEIGAHITGCFGYSFEAVYPRLALLLAKKLIKRRGGRYSTYQLTALGRKALTKYEGMSVPHGKAA